MPFNMDIGTSESTIMPASTQLMMKAHGSAGQLGGI
jgi:hypothetical protein